MSRNTLCSNSNRSRCLAIIFLFLIFGQIEGQRRSAEPQEEITFQQVTEREYQKAFNELWPLGFRPESAKVQTIDGEVLFSLRMKKPKFPIDCQANHLLTDARFSELDQKYKSQDYKLRIHETFDWFGTRRHLAIWMRASKAQPLGQIWKLAKQVPASGKARRRFRALDNLYKSFLFKNQIPGATVAVAYQGKIIYERGFGYSELDDEIEMLPETRMRIASISKPITAAAIMRLVDQRKLSLSQPVFQTILVPKDAPVDPRIQNITIDHLLRHRGGWDRGKSYDPMFIQQRIAKHFETKTPVGTDKIVEYMLTQPLDFTPGTKEVYSNFGYCVLGRVIEKITKMNYETYVRNEILGPVGANSMAIGGTLKSELQSDETHYYSRTGRLANSIIEPGKSDQPRQYGGWHLESLDSHGGWISSAGDLVKFASAFDAPNDCPIMSADAVKTMFIPFELTRLNRSKSYYAYGWRVVLIADGKANTFHSGKLTGTSTMLVRRHDGYTWAFLFNCGSDLNGKTLSSKMDSLMHQAVNAVKN